MTITRIEDHLPDSLTDRSWSSCELRIKAFEQAWRAGQSPDIKDYVIGDGPARQSLLFELLHTDLELQFKAGRAARVEEYLQQFPEVEQHSGALIDLVAAEYQWRCRCGDPVELDEFLRRFPQWQDVLRVRLAEVDARRTDKWITETDRESIPLEVAGYEIVAEIGRGGMGIVYQAYDRRLDRHVALKWLPADMARDAQLLGRFRREAQTASALNHPHICTIHALGEFEGRPFIVLEFIEGETLRSLAARQPDLATLFDIIGQASGALAAAHAAGVVHRDIKPENIMVRPDGHIKVVDFGLARRLPMLTVASDPAAEPTRHDTEPGAILGTVAYMSPEQVSGESLTSASDIFSLGIVFYQLLTGWHPFAAESVVERMHAIAHRSPLPPRKLNPSIPPAVEQLVLAMLHKDARLRPPADQIKTVLGGQASSRLHNESAPPKIVHRERELNVLRENLARTETGNGALVCVIGEPGIGKTTLVEDFLEDIGRDRMCAIGRGRCAERQVGTAAYLPIIDALTDLLRTDPWNAIGRVMQVVAPSWYAQLALHAHQDGAAPARAFTQQAMLREFCSLLEEISRWGPVVIFLDDMHWADTSTVDLLTYIGRHWKGMRILVVATIRPTELLLGPHPFYQVKLELQGQGLCTDIVVGFMERIDIVRYLDLAFPGHAFPDDFAAKIHARTEGNPLFMVDLLRDLKQRGVIRQSGDTWTLVDMSLDHWHQFPETVRSMIQRKLDRLELRDRRLLGTAAVQGGSFDSTVVASALGWDVAEVEEQLQLLDRVHGLVRRVRDYELPDGQLASNYTFVHVLYRQAIFADLTPTRRTEISKGLAGALERHHGKETAGVAAEVACLYETGRDFLRAAHYFHVAAQHAARIFAHQDAILLARRGLRLLESVAVATERDALELPLQTTLGLQLQMTEGYAADSARRAYLRARQLCPSSSPSSFFPVLWGLWLVHKVRSELTRAQEVAQELADLAGALRDPDLALQSHQALGLTALCRGKPVLARQHVEQVATLYHRDRHHTHAYLFGQDPGVICKAYGAVSQWLLGFPDTAVRESVEAIQMSHELSPTSQAVALHFAAMVHQLCGLVNRACQYAERSAAIATEHGLSFWLSGAHVIRGWALAASDPLHSGVNLLKQGVADWQSTGSVTYLTYYLGLLAESLAKQGQVADAERTIDEAITLADQTDERLYEAELWRLRGELSLRRDDLVPSSTWALRAEDCIGKAIDTASAQEARTLELRARMSLVRLRQRIGTRLEEARGQLANTIDSFHEGLEMPDLVAARELLMMP